MNLNGFRVVKPDMGMTMPELVPLVLLDSIKFFEGSIVKMVPSTTAAAADLADAVTDYVFGIVESFVTKNRLPLQIDTGAYTGTFAAATTGDAYTCAATNTGTTGEKVMALVRPVQNCILSGLLTAAVGTTTGSNLAGNYFAVSTTAGEKATKLDESSISSSISNTQFISLPSFPGSVSPLDPAVGSTTRILVKAFRCQQTQIA